MLPQTETLVTFEYASPLNIRKPHSLLFIGGLGDGLATTEYMADVVRALQPTEWSLFSLNLSSSYNSWGLGHLDRDTDEIALCLQYIKDYKLSHYGSGNDNGSSVSGNVGDKRGNSGIGGKVVLMGHSTGSQHVLHYLSRSNPHTSTPAYDSTLSHTHRMAIDGAIMQAPVSDRQAIHWVLETGWRGKTSDEVRAVYNSLESMAKKAVAEVDQSFDTLLPMHMTYAIGYPANTPLTARRFLSLVSPGSPAKPSEDDLFSSDLSDEHLKTTFGRIRERNLLKSKLMVLYSGADGSVPTWVDKEALLARWRKAADAGMKGEKEIWDGERSAVIPNASHALSNDDQAEPRKFLCERVLGFLSTV